MERLKIAVLFGGCSGEYKISLQSAYAVITHLDNSKYEPVLVGITASGQWFRYTGDPEKIKDDTWFNEHDCVRAVISPCRETHGLVEFRTDKPYTIRLDAAIPMLHGRNGEDGTVQGLLELAGIPVIGCRTLCSALCMDKDRAHKIVGLAGVRVPRAFVIKDDKEKASALAQADQIGYPLFVKPVKSGSSFGITKVADQKDFLAAVRLAFSFDDEVIVEENIPGFEVGCAVLGNDKLTIGVVDEIELAGGFFDYHEKYVRVSAKIHLPARITDKQSDEIKKTAAVIYKALGCTGFARVDMFLTPDGEIVFNEVNTIPGFTVQSRYPNMLKAAGMTMEEIVNSIIELAVEA